VDNIKQLLVQAQAAYDASDSSSLTERLQQLISKENSESTEVVKNQELMLKLALSVLENGDFKQRWEVAQVFSHLGTIAIPPLVEILKEEDTEEELRWFIARLLGELKQPDAIPPLVELLKNAENEELREVAALALGQIGTAAITVLTELLAEENIRLKAVQALSYIRQKETIIPLLSVVKDAQVAIRVTAIEALSSFHDERIPPVLLNALNDIAPPVRREAVLGLGFRADLEEQLDLVAKLQEKLYDLNIEVCCAAAVALSRIGGDEAATHLFQVLISPHTPPRLQLETIRALSWVGTLSALEYLQQAVNQLQSPDIWLEFVTVLGRIQSPSLTDKAGEILLEMLHSKHPAVDIPSIKSAIALSLGYLGKLEAIDPLIQMLADQDTQVRFHAIAALKKLLGESAYHKLQVLARDISLPPDLQQGVIAALAEW
jgi:HEAT repeat protein